MSASSPGPDDKSGITEIALPSDRFYVQRTVSAITVFDEEWNQLFTQSNLGQPDTVIAQAVSAYQVGRKQGQREGRAAAAFPSNAFYRQQFSRMLGAQPAKEEG